MSIKFTSDWNLPINHCRRKTALRFCQVCRIWGCIRILNGSPMKGMGILYNPTQFQFLNIKWSGVNSELIYCDVDRNSENFSGHLTVEPMDERLSNNSLLEQAEFKLRRSEKQQVDGDWSKERQIVVHAFLRTLTVMVESETFVQRHCYSNCRTNQTNIKTKHWNRFIFEFGREKFSIIRKKTSRSRIWLDKVFGFMLRHQHCEFFS